MNLELIFLKFLVLLFWQCLFLVALLLPKKLGKADSARWLTICFTGDRKWIA